LCSSKLARRPDDDPRRSTFMSATCPKNARRRASATDRHPTTMRTRHRRHVRNRCLMPDRDHQQPTSRA
jgi:hypothetical protein